MNTTILLLGLSVLLVLFVFLRLEIAFAVGIVGILWLFFAGEPLQMIASRSFSGINSFTLLAIPLFMFAGELMNRTNITNRLITMANLSVGRFKGGLAHANIGSSLMFAGISGSAVADTAAMGSVFVPAMDEQGYDRDFSAAVTAASSVIGPIIPPSISMIVYGAVTGTSIGGLFAAAIVPGLMLAGMLMVMTTYQAHKHDYPTYDTSVSRGDVPSLLFNSLTALTIPAIIVGGIVFGFFTATEAAAVAVTYAVLLGTFVYRALSISDFVTGLRESMERFAQIYIILATAAILSWLIAVEGIPAQIATGIAELGVGSMGFFLILVVVLLFVGTWLPSSAAIIVLAPTFVEIAAELGIHRLHFGIVFCVTILYGLITPPLGLSIFVSASVARTPVWDISKRIAVFYVPNFLVLVLLVLVPEISLFIPRMTGYA